MVIFSRPLAAFFGFRELHVAADTQRYIFITGMGVPASFIAAVLSGTFTASGNSKAPFVINGIGLGANMLLDPLFIFGFGMGLRGAAIATIIAQWIVALVLFMAMHKLRDRPFPVYGFKVHLDGRKIQAILKWGVPVGMETVFFCFLTMLCSRLEASFGAGAIAAGKVGSQLESLTWLIGGGFGSALVAFIGQNYGAGQSARIKDGVRVSVLLMTAWGVLTSVFIITLGPIVFTLFLPEPEIAKLGRVYVGIFVFCQLPMNLEAVASGVYNGLGRTMPPATVSIISNILKPVLAYLFASMGFGIAGVWAGICAPDVIRCIWIWAWYLAARKRLH
jgi:putative MATE family efflux protein